MWLLLPADYLDFPPWNQKEGVLIPEDSPGTVPPAPRNRKEDMAVVPRRSEEASPAIPKDSEEEAPLVPRDLKEAVPVVVPQISSKQAFQRSFVSRSRGWSRFLRESSRPSRATGKATGKAP